MPPKPKFTREAIITAAFDIAREKGIEAVVAREVGRKLQTSVSPIFSLFSGMDELRQEVYLRAKEHCADYLRECIRFSPAFKEFGLRWIRFARKEPNLFQMLFWSGKLHGEFPEGISEVFPDVLEPLLEEIKKEFDLSEADAKWLFHHMMIQANGIASLVLCSEMEFSEETIGRSLSESCLGTLFFLKLKNNSLNREMAMCMISGTDRLPKEKERGNTNAEN